MFSKKLHVNTKHRQHSKPDNWVPSSVSWQSLPCVPADYCSLFLGEQYAPAIFDPFSWYEKELWTTTPSPEFTPNALCIIFNREGDLHIFTDNKIRFLLNFQMVGRNDLVVVVCTMLPVIPNLMGRLKTLCTLSKLLFILLIPLHLLNMVLLLIAAYCNTSMLTVVLWAKVQHNYPSHGICVLVFVYFFHWCWPFQKH